MNIFLLCAAILIVFYGALSANVSRVRRRRPAATEAELIKSIRAHGNASEYIPIFVAIFLYLQSGQARPLLAGAAIVATLSRILHATGMLSRASVSERHPFRTFGAVGTYACLFIFGIAFLFRLL